MKFNHLTVNSNNNLVQDVKKIFISSESKRKMEKIYMKIMSNNGKPVAVSDGVYARGVEECDVYSISLCDENGVVLFETQGTINANRQCELEDGIRDMHTSHWKSDIKIRKLDVPIVYDLLVPAIIGRLDIIEWIGDFSRCMGAMAFERMNKK